MDAKKLHSGAGYVMTGHRILAENSFECTYEILSHIPTLHNPKQTVKEHIDEFNAQIKTYAKARLVQKGKVIDAHSLDLTWKDRYNLSKVLAGKEKSLDGLRISDYFDSAFFQTNFWYEFCTVFAFQPWHSLIEFRRYIYRSFQALPFYDTMECVISAPYNQHDSIVLPMLKWLKNQGVNFETKTSVTNLKIKTNKNTKTVKKIYLLKNKIESEV